MQHWHRAAACFSVLLGYIWKIMGVPAVSCEKIFAFCENFVCICEKMGYNKMD